MFLWLARKIAISFIKGCMSHERAEDRNLLFRTIMVAMEDEFKEDNFPTRFYSLMVWLLKNDSTFIKESFKSGVEFETKMEALTSQAVATAFQDTVYTGKE